MDFSNLHLSTFVQQSTQADSTPTSPTPRQFFQQEGAKKLRHPTPPLEGHFLWRGGGVLREVLGTDVEDNGEQVLRAIRSRYSRCIGEYCKALSAEYFGLRNIAFRIPPELYPGLAKKATSAFYNSTSFPTTFSRCQPGFARRSTN